MALAMGSSFSEVIEAGKHAWEVHKLG
jgi:hypothetical protein